MAAMPFPGYRADPWWWPATAGTPPDAAARPPAGVVGGAGKLPRLTLAFWIMKIAATTLGETGGDLLSMTLRFGYVFSSLLLVLLLAAALAGQLAVRRYYPALFWSVILLTSTAGTTLSDMLDRTLRLGYPRGAALLLGLLCGVFAVWHATGEPFSVARIRSRRVEVLYWAAILVSNTLGATLGDVPSAACRHEKEVFFFEKKNQKTFIHCGHDPRQRIERHA